VLEKLEENRERQEQLRQEQIDLLREGRRLGLPVTELAKAAGLSRATVHRYLKEVGDALSEPPREP
jgi:DNA-binding IclR family transcriptional regulator